MYDHVYIIYAFVIFLDEPLCNYLIEFPPRIPHCSLMSRFELMWDSSLKYRWHYIRDDSHFYVNVFFLWVTSILWHISCWSNTTTNMQHQNVVWKLLNKISDTLGSRMNIELLVKNVWVTSNILHNQCPGSFWVIIVGQYPSDSKSSRLHVDIFRFAHSLKV